MAREEGGAVREGVTPGWEGVHQEESTGTYTDRLPVHGGWLYRVNTLVWIEHPSGDTRRTTAVSVVFVPERKESP